MVPFSRAPSAPCCTGPLSRIKPALFAAQTGKLHFFRSARHKQCFQWNQSLDPSVLATACHTFWCGDTNLWPESPRFEPDCQVGRPLRRLSPFQAASSLRRQDSGCPKVRPDEPEQIRPIRCRASTEGGHAAGLRIGAFRLTPARPTAPDSSNGSGAAPASAYLPAL